jgi:hypothetical protein
MLGSAPGNLMPDASILQGLAMRTAIIGTVGLHTGGFVKRAPALAGDGRHTFYQRR